MIRNQWYVVLESKEVKAGRPVGVTRLGEKMVFWRHSDGRLVCLGDICPHLGASLSQGKITADCTRLACPFHGFEYDASGACQYVPALGRAAAIPKALKARAYPTYEAHGLIWIYWGEAGTGQSQPLQPKFFEHSIPPNCSYASFRQHWPVHYSRVIENQLDLAHLPFVHSNTIGRSGRAVVDGPLFKLEEDLLLVWYANRLEDGTPARRAEELPPPPGRPLLEFRFPNLWHNWLSDENHITIAFVPVDEENTLLYGRYYQRMVHLPILRLLVNLIGKYGSAYIAHQDRRIVSNQRPKKTSLRKMGEKILPCDQVILTYRTRRQALKEAAGQED